MKEELSKARTTIEDLQRDTEKAKELHIRITAQLEAKIATMQKEVEGSQKTLEAASQEAMLARARYAEDL